MILIDKIIIVSGGSGLIGKEIMSNIKQEGGFAINADIAVETNLNEGLINIDVTNDKSIQLGCDMIIKKLVE